VKPKLIAITEFPDLLDRPIQALGQSEVFFASLPVESEKSQAILITNPPKPYPHDNPCEAWKKA
jgi:hypothetical protein